LLTTNERYDNNEKGRQPELKHVSSGKENAALLNSQDLLQRQGGRIENTAPSSSSSPSLLGVSVYHLCTVFSEDIQLYYCNNNNDDGKSRTVVFEDVTIADLLHQSDNVTSFILHKIKNSISEDGASYVESLNVDDDDDHVGVATHKLSYSSTNKIADITSALADFCRSKGSNPKRTYIWLSCLCSDRDNGGGDDNDNNTVVLQSFNRNNNNGTTTLEQQQQRQITKNGENNILCFVIPSYEKNGSPVMMNFYEYFTALRNENCNVDIIIPPSEKRKLIGVICAEDESVGDITRKLLSIFSIGDNEDDDDSSDEESLLLDQRGRSEKERKGSQDNNYEDYMYTKINSSLKQWIFRTLLMELIKESEREEYLSELLDQIAALYNHNGKYDRAIECYKKSITVMKNGGGVFDEDGNNIEESEIAMTYSTIGMCYMKKGDFAKALVYYQKCLEIEEQRIGNDYDDADIATSYNNIGLCYNKQREYDLAITYFNKAVAAYGKDNHPRQIAATYLCIGIAYKEQKKLSILRYGHDVFR